MRGAGFAKVVKPAMTREPPQLQKGKRAEVSSFSERSRQRLRIKIASVCRANPPLFCTLTYPVEWTWDAKLWKRHLKIFSQRFCRRYPAAGFIWKLEFQKRGAPHFHPFVWGIGDELREFRHWISDVWNEIAGDGDPNHLMAGTSVERMRRPEAAIRYVSGYASKSDQTRPGERVGRYWGILGRDQIPWGGEEQIVLDQSEAIIVMRTIRRFMMAGNRERRIRRVAKLVGLKPSELVSWGGWFERKPIHYGKHLRAAGRRMPQKLRLRNLSSMNVFLNADFWAVRISRLLD